MKWITQRSVTAQLGLALGVIVLHACVTESKSTLPSSSQSVATFTASLAADTPKVEHHAARGNLPVKTNCPVECPIQSSNGCPTGFENGAAAEVNQTPSNELVVTSTALVSREHLVSAQRTPLSGEEAAKRIERAYRHQVGGPPSRETLALLTAHWAHESNQGASMFNYNFGGIKGVGPNGAYVVSRTREGVGLSERRNRHRFRAYASAAEGAEDYIALLQRHYFLALRAAMRGDIDGFVKGLKAGGYFSGDEDLYLRKIANFVTYSEQWGFDALGPSGISPKYKVASNTMVTPS